MKIKIWSKFSVDTDIWKANTRRFTGMHFFPKHPRHNLSLKPYLKLIKHQMKCITKFIKIFSHLFTNYIKHIYNNTFFISAHKKVWITYINVLQRREARQNKFAYRYVQRQNTPHNRVGAITGGRTCSRIFAKKNCTGLK